MRRPVLTGRGREIRQGCCRRCFRWGQLAAGIGSEVVRGRKEIRVETCGKILKVE
jgi:hypothetical protein